MSYLSTGNPRDDDRMVGDRKGFQEDVGDIGYTQGMLGVFPNDEGMTRPFGDIRDIGQL